MTTQHELSQTQGELSQTQRELSQTQVLPGLLPDLLKEVSRREPGTVEHIGTLVSIESPSSSKSAVDQAQSCFAEWARAAGGNVVRHYFAESGDSLEVRFGEGLGEDHGGQPPLLLLGHMDTVWNVGTLATMPWHATPDRLQGPGVLDMKSGLMMALTAVEVLQELQLLRRPVTLLIHGDEEVGSPASRELTEAEARRAGAVYVLEPAQGDAGAYKTARKGVGRYHLKVNGIPAHSGVDFESGHSAIVELARQIGVLHSLTDLSKGTTINPGVIGGGTGSNVVAAEAWVDIDVRVAHAQHVAQIDHALRSLQPFDTACKLTVSGGMNRPPMERTPAGVALFLRAQQLGGQLGIALDEAATGGASDGNFTAALGVPTLDGMGAVGAGAHANHEHVVRGQLVPRIALLAAMLL